MKAVFFDGPGRIRVSEVPDARIVEPTDAVVRVTLSSICGTDLSGYHGHPVLPGPGAGHEFLGVVEDVGEQVRLLRPGMLVVAPFMWSDGECGPCRASITSACEQGGMWGGEQAGGQAEAVRVPFADTTLVQLPMLADDERLPAVLTLADVMATGLHAIRTTRVFRGASVAVVGDGAVGLCATLAAALAGAEQIILLSSHPGRARLGKLFGATDHVPERGEPAHERVLDLTKGRGVDAALDCAGGGQPFHTAVAVTRPGGSVGVVGAPHPEGVDLTYRFLRNVTVTGGLTPARVYLPYLLDELLTGRLDPAAVFDLTVPLDDIATGYRAMAERTAIKTLVRV
ncbi:zinc-binding dehydrogenase [Nocardia sp. NPDC051929]|uniref:zinc-binding dehydrogenase n=1 Tax=unclassified Nocardia TaxID=2637762 RepID=UPI00379FA587